MRSSVVGLLVVAALLATSAASAWEVRGTLRQTGNGYKDCDPTVQQWSGYFDIPGKNVDKHYFYWGFGPRNGDPNAPIILWLTGGPGCSSSMALLFINGPCHINETTDEMYRNAYSWNTDAYVFYLDQPAGVGFSYADRDEDFAKDEDGVSEDIYNFLQRFFEAHKEWRTNDFFIVGESYAGHYAPAAAHRIFVGNERGDGPYINLMGVGIGNGLTVASVQFETFPWLAYDWCIEKKGEPCVSYDTYVEMKALADQCVREAERCNGDTPDADDYCFNASDTCDDLMDKYAQSGLNMNNIRFNGSYEMGAMGRFLNREDVQRELGVESMEWQVCNDDIFDNFTVDIIRNFNHTIPPLIENGIRVMLYAGDLDFICNWKGNENWALQMAWAGHDRLNAAPNEPFYAEGREAGLVRSVAAFWSPIQMSIVRVYEAGHMSPMDQPAATLELVRRFLFNQKLSD